MKDDVNQVRLLKRFMRYCNLQRQEILHLRELLVRAEAKIKALHKK